MSNRKKTITALWEHNEGKCSICGNSIDINKECVSIEHIFPVSMGGTDSIENLVLLCPRCGGYNNSISRRISETDFQKYLAKLLASDNRFKNILCDVKHQTKDGRRQRFDLVFDREIGGVNQHFVVELKMMMPATEEAVKNTIRQMHSYQQACPGAHIILAVPTTLAIEYEYMVREAGFSLWDSEIIRQGIPDTALPSETVSDKYHNLIAQLSQCNPGMEDWRVYQQLVGTILNELFSPPLEPASEQNSDGIYLNRRDYIMANYVEAGYWRYLRERYKAEFIVVDAKNSKKPVSKNDILQVAHYLKSKGLGLFGLIFSRVGISKAAEEHLKDIWQNEDKMLVILNDSDVEQMLLLKQTGEDPCKLIVGKIQEFRQKI